MFSRRMLNHNDPRHRMTTSGGSEPWPRIAKCILLGSVALYAGLAYFLMRWYPQCAALAWVLLFLGAHSLAWWAKGKP